MVTVNVPTYSQFINLDKLVRDFSTPTILNEQYAHEVQPRFLIMQRALVSTGRDIGIFHMSHQLGTAADTIYSPPPTSPPFLH